MVNILHSLIERQIAWRRTREKTTEKSNLREHGHLILVRSASSCSFRGVLVVIHRCPVKEIEVDVVIPA